MKTETTQKLRFVKRFKINDIRISGYQEETETILQQSFSELIEAQDGEYMDEALSIRTQDMILWSEWEDVDLVDLTKD